VIDDPGTLPGPVNCRTSERSKWGRVQTSIVPWIFCVVKVRLNRDFFTGLVSGVTTTMTAIEVLKDGTPCLGIRFFHVRPRMEWETMRSIHRLIVISIGPPRTCTVQVTAAGSRTQVTRPGRRLGELLMGKADRARGAAGSWQLQ